MGMEAGDMMDMNRDMNLTPAYCAECGEEIHDFACPISTQLCRNCYNEISDRCDEEAE